VGTQFRVGTQHLGTAWGHSTWVEGWNMATEVHCPRAGAEQKGLDASIVMDDAKRLRKSRGFVERETYMRNRHQVHLHPE
jgi:hypothetical protein